MAAKSGATLKAQFRGTDPDQHNQDLVDSMAVGSQQTAIEDLAITFTANDPGTTPDSALTIADGATPTVAELLHYCTELNAKVAALRDALEAYGILAASS